MRREFDIFERFADGSSIWRVTVIGRYEAQRKIQELAEHSENAFFTIDIHETQRLSVGLPTRSSRRMLEARAASG